MPRERTVPEIYPCLMVEIEKSNTIARIGHYEMGYHCYLKVQFKEKGATYIYFGVPVALYERFLTAHSKGTFYNNQVKGKFQSLRLV